MSTVLEILKRAITDSTMVSIVYNGGSRPGQSRQLIPLSISNDELVAREPTTRIAKTFKLQKVAAVTFITGEEAKSPDVIPVPNMLAPTFDAFDEYAAYFRGLIDKKNFGVVEKPNFFAVFGFFKNGNLRKTPLVSIQYLNRSVKSVINFESGEIELVHHELTGRERPWRVDSIKMQEGKTFSQLSNAVELFLQELRANT